MSGEDWVVWLAGAGAPPEETYRDCIEHIGHRVRSLTKGLELFDHAEPPHGYSLDFEVDGILRELDRRSIERAHLVGYSGGGGVALAFALEHPARVLTLALDEHVVGHRFGVEDEQQFWDDLDRALALDGLDATLAVVAATNAPHAAPLEFADPPPPWLMPRVAGTPALARAALDRRVSREDLAGFRCPVYTAYGTNTRAAFKNWCETVAAVVEKGRAECYDGCDHFRPAHASHPERFASALLEHWTQPTT